MTQLLPVWVTSENVDLVLEFLAPHPVIGLDSEFDSVDLRTESPVYRGRLDVISIAVPIGKLNAAGFHECASYVIPFDLVHHFKALLEDPAVLKVAHNLPMEAHVLGNIGIWLVNGLNTLSMARFAYPERANLKRGVFDLDSMCRDRFGRCKTEDFDELFGYDYQEPYLADERRMWCLTCDGLSCRKKNGHPKEWREVQVPRTRKRRGIIPLSEVRPGHALFARYLIYAAIDAVLAFQLWELMVRDMEAMERFYPWVGFAGLFAKEDE